MSSPLKILVSRTDRLGDVMLALPSLDLLRRKLPGALIDFLVRPELVDLLGGFLRERAIRPLTVLDDEWARPRAIAYDAALVLFDDPQVLRRLWQRRVRIRVGPYSKARSFVFLTHGLRQRRGLAEKNEALYNWDLARRLLLFLGVPVDAAMPAGLSLPVDETGRNFARAALANFGVAPSADYGVVHPGMGGSAVNLSAEGYLSLIASMEKKNGGQILLSRGPSVFDRDIVDAISRARPELKILEGLELRTLAEVFRSAKWVIAPSTGPLHLAHYVGAATTGIFPPVRSQSPARWRPFGGTGKSTVISPSHDCPGKRECLGEVCPHYFCLDRLVLGGVTLEAQASKG